MMQPSFAQMKNRSSGHMRALQKVAASEKLLGVGAAPSEVRGMQTMLRTLRRWNCIEIVKTADGCRYVVTDRGHDFLAAFPP